MSSSLSSSSSIKPQPLAEKLLAVMETENRPFAFADIHERVGKATAKHLLLKCIDLHVANHRIIEKTYGKQKIYCFNNKLSKVNSEAVTNREFRSNFLFQFSRFRSNNTTSASWRRIFKRTQNPSGSYSRASPRLKDSWKSTRLTFPCRFPCFKRSTMRSPRA